MNFKRFFVSTTLIFISLSAFSQIDSTRRDSIEEIIIYEYDTIYIQPDTIRITDTIFDIKKRDSLRVTRTNKSKRLSSRGNFSMKGFLPKSFGFSVVPYTYFNPQILPDTLNPQQVLNMSYRFQLNYYTNKYLVSYGLTYTPYHEQFSGNDTIYSSNHDTVYSGSYDSIRIINNYQIDYYYDYLSLDLMLGRKFTLSKKLELNLNIGASAGFLIGYRQGNTAISDSMIRKTNFSLLFSPQLIYKISRKFEFKLAPFYQNAIFEKKKSPYLLRQRTGFEIGLNYVL